jgi:hypothetical protein
MARLHLAARARAQCRLDKSMAQQCNGPSTGSGRAGKVIQHNIESAHAEPVEASFAPWLEAYLTGIGARLPPTPCGLGRTCSRARPRWSRCARHKIETNQFPSPSPSRAD